MSRQGDQKDQQSGAVFQTSRRVTFVARTAVRSPRTNLDNASRDPMTSIEIDVHNAMSSTPSALGVESDWSAVMRLMAGKKVGRFSLQAAGSTGSFAAHIAAIGSSAFLLPGDFDVAGEPSTQLLLDHDLYEQLVGRTGALEIALAPPHETNFVSFGELAKRLPGDSQETVGQKAAEPVETIPVKLQPDASPDAGVNAAERLRALTSPKTFPQSAYKSLSRNLTSMEGAFSSALLFQAEYVDGHCEYLIGICGADDSQIPAIERAVDKALSTLEDEIQELGITFFNADDPMVVRIARVGQRLA